MFKLFTRLFDKASNGYIKAKHHITLVYKDKVLLRKIFYTFFLLTIFVICGTITIPRLKLLNFQLDNNSFLGIINTVGGGGLLNFSIVALGIGPFITASLIMMIAQTKLVPPIHRLSQSGPHGRRKINIITRTLTLIIALVQALILVRTVITNTQLRFVTIEDNSFGYLYIGLPLILVAGSMFTLFLSEQITDKGVGNGTSLIIFSGIAIGLPRRFHYAFDYIISHDSVAKISEILGFLAYVFGFVLLMVLVTYIYLAERKIPIQQTGSGMTKNIKEISTLPIKLNPAGIMPIIFSLIVVSLPSLFTGFLDPNTSATSNWIRHNLRIQDPLGLTIFIFFNIIFSVVMSLQQSRVDKISEDFAKNSTFIPGIRPGEQTEDYLIGVVLRLSVFSAIYLTSIGVLQPLEIIFGMPQAITFSGTSVIILATTALETLSQIKARHDAEKIIVKRKKINKNMEKGIIHDRDLLW